MNKGLLLMGLIILGALAFFVKEYRKDKMNWFGFMPVLALCLIHIVIYSTQVEDAFISFRYAKNLSAGLGLVFNPGERVEGYSNFLWVVTLAFIHRVTSFDIPKLAYYLGMACSLLSVGLTFYLGKNLSNHKWTVGWGAALLLSSMGSFAAHGAGGLETSCFTLLLLLGMLFTLQERFVLAGICYSVSLMTRPEGVINLALAGVWLLFRYRDKKIFFRSIVRLTLPFIILILPWTLWRFHYYGYWLPNAMAAKNGADLVHRLSTGRVYLLTFLYAHLPLVVTMFLSLLCLVASGWFQVSLKTKAGVILIGLNLIAMFSFAVYVGGDWMPAWRYLVPAIPLLCILVSLMSFECLKYLDSALASLGSGLLMGVLAVACCQSSYLYPNMLQKVELWGLQVSGLADIGKWMRETLPTDTRVAVIPNGALSYHSMLPTIDMHGLTDEHISRRGLRMKHGNVGHIAYDDEYVVSRKPKVIVMDGGGFASAPLLKTSNQIFSKFYQPVSFYFKEGKNPTGQYVNLLLLKDEKRALITFLGKTKDVVPIESNLP